MKLIFSHEYQTYILTSIFCFLRKVYSKAEGFDWEEEEEEEVDKTAEEEAEEQEEEDEDE